MKLKIKPWRTTGKCCLFVVLLTCVLVQLSSRFFSIIRGRSDHISSMDSTSFKKQEERFKELMLRLDAWRKRDSKMLVENVDNLVTSSPTNQKSNKSHTERNENGERFDHAIKINIEPVCDIPKLDPFDKAAIAQMKNVKELKCTRKYYSQVKTGYLHVKADKVRDAYFEYIRRPNKDDFTVEYSKKIKLTGKYIESNVKEGKVGCLIDSNHRILALSSNEDKKKINIVATENCTHEHFWIISPERKIEHYLKSKCIGRNVSSSLNSTLILVDCDKNALKFTVLPDNRIFHESTKTYLSFLKDSTIKKSNEKLMLVANNNMASTWSMLDKRLEDLDIRRAVQEDFIKVTLIRERQKHEEFHASVFERQDLIKQAKNSRKKSGLPYNIAFFLLDSQSHSNVKRKLPKTYQTLENDRNTFIFDGHTIVGDGTTAQLCAILVGSLEEDLPEGRRGYPGAKPVDRWPFIFKELKERGYITMFSEEESFYGAFNYRLHGFTDPLTDHYARPFWMKAKIDYSWEGECIGDRPVFQKSFDYALSFHDKYKNVPKFSLTSISTICHNELNRIQNADQAITDVYKHMKSSGQLENTILVIFGDHGARLSDFRETIVGKLEERLPFLSITLPEELVAEGSNLRQAMLHNSKLLTSHFDIHATLKHLIHYPNTSKVSVGQSLFTKINEKTRTCASAGVKEHWCPCLQFTTLNVTDPIVVKSVEAVVQFINQNLTWKVPEGKSLCEKLEVDAIRRAGKKIPNKIVQRFKHTNQNDKCIDCEVVLGDEPGRDDFLALEVVFTVRPSNGLYEASVTIRGDHINVASMISRINAYGNQPSCIENKYPHLRKFCYCKSKEAKLQARQTIIS